MSHKAEQAVVEATQEKEAMIYDVFGLTEKQADAIIDNVTQASKTLKATGNQCDFLREALAKVETPEEKQYTCFVAGKMSEEESDPFMGLFGRN